MDNQKPPNSNAIYVRVATPRSVLFDGWAYSVSGKNSEGKFDILAQHANFLTIVESGAIVIQTIERKMLKFDVNQAIVYNVSNKVSVYVDPKSAE